MKRHIYYSLVVVLSALFMVSCSTGKRVKKSDFIGNLTETEYWESVLANHSGMYRKALTAKMSLLLDLDGKSTKVSGTLRIKKGEVIQLSVAPLLGIEVARVEISPEGVQAIDRMNKRYVKVSFAELETLAKAKLDFHTIQALFFNELFLPGKTELSIRDISAFDIEQEGEVVRLDVRKSRKFSYRFLTQATDALLEESFIGLKDTSYGVCWKYSDFRLLEQKPFPTDMKIVFRGGKKPMNVDISLSRLSTNSNWETHTKLSGKYEKVPLEDLIKQLLK